MTILIMPLYFLLFYFLLQSEAQELTIVKMSKFGGGIGAPSKEERLKAAAEIHLRLGQIQRYCELMVELGEVTFCFHRISKFHPALTLERYRSAKSMFFFSVFIFK